MCWWEWGTPQSPPPSWEKFLNIPWFSPKINNWGEPTFESTLSDSPLAFLADNDTLFKEENMSRLPFSISAAQSVTSLKPTDCFSSVIVNFRKKGFLRTLVSQYEQCSCPSYMLPFHFSAVLPEMISIWNCVQANMLWFANSSFRDSHKWIYSQSAILVAGVHLGIRLHKSY